MENDFDMFCMLEINKKKGREKVEQMEAVLCMMNKKENEKNRKKNMLMHMYKR